MATTVQECVCVCMGTAAMARQAMVLALVSLVGLVPTATKRVKEGYKRLVVFTAPVSKQPPAVGATQGTLQPTALSNALVVEPATAKESV